MSAAAFLSFGNIAFAGDSELCASEYAQGAYESAFRCYEKACSQNDGPSCFYLGGLYEDGRGVKQDIQQAKTYKEKACSLNYAASCFWRGEAYLNGRGVRQDYQRAKNYHEKACSLLNFGWSCMRLGTLSKVNKKVSKEYYGKACDLGLQEGCDEYRKLNEQGY